MMGHMGWAGAEDEAGDEAVGVAEDEAVDEAGDEVGDEAVGVAEVEVAGWGLRKHQPLNRSIRVM
jgi:hypothetical protein